jgi:hypothetical protein
VINRPNDFFFNFFFRFLVSLVNISIKILRWKSLAHRENRLPFIDAHSDILQRSKWKRNVKIVAGNGNSLSEYVRQP